MTTFAIIKTNGAVCSAILDVMKYKASIDIMPHKELLDPQGKTVEKNLGNVDISGINNVRIGKHIELLVEAGSEADAKEKVDLACKKILVNVIMEGYTFELLPVS